jgi:ferredoxin
MKLEVDMIACDGRGLCAEVLPELIVLDDWGFPIITGAVPDDLADQAREAVRICPRLAIRLAR